VTPADADGLRATFAEAHRRYTGTINARFRWTGHLFRGRFGAGVMDEPHWLAAAHYIALNPVVAGLVSRAEDWPWSSTWAQLASEDDELTTVAPLRALIPDFAALLAMPTDAATTTRIGRAPTIGRPLGRPEWIAMLERRLGRPLAPRKSDQSREWRVYKTVLLISGQGRANSKTSYRKSRIDAFNISSDVVRGLLLPRMPKSATVGQRPPRGWGMSDRASCSWPLS
jgi:hypothetical protein